MQLSSMGHEYDGLIGGVAKAGLAVAAVTTVVATAGSALPAIGSLVAGNAADIVDTVSDVASIASNRKTRQYIGNDALQYGDDTTHEMETVDSRNQETGQKMGTPKGEIIETGVSWITDNLRGKPQRRRAINDYISGTLLPEFTAQMNKVQSNLTRMIKDLLHDEAKASTAQKEQTLREMEHEKEHEREVYNQKVNQLKEFKNILIKEDNRV
jgi:hypothetical protein